MGGPRGIVVVGISSALLSCRSAPQATPVLGVPRAIDVESDGMLFDCDAPAGYTSESSQRVAGRWRARGAVYIATARHGGGWAPVANVVLLSEDRRGRAGLTIALDKHWRNLIPTVRYTADRRAKNERFQPLQPRDITAVPFEMEWDESRARIRLEATAPWLEIALDFVPDRFALQCSTGEAVFHGVSLTAEDDAAPQ